MLVSSSERKEKLRRSAEKGHLNCPIEEEDDRRRRRSAVEEESAIAERRRRRGAKTLDPFVGILPRDGRGEFTVTVVYIYISRSEPLVMGPINGSDPMIQPKVHIAPNVIYLWNQTSFKMFWPSTLISII